MTETLAAMHHDAEAAPAEQLVVSESVEPHDLRRLLEALAQEGCAHSWRNFGPDGTLEALLQWENARRPTTIFFFYLKRGSEARMAAAGAVASGLNRDFHHPGFCVLGRCYIMPELRSLGLYRRVLCYRLEHCRARLGRALDAVHIGASSERISRVITDHGLPGWPRFIHLGEERLGVAGEVREVGAYLMLLPDYLRRIEASLAGSQAPESVLELRDVLSRIGSGSIRNLGLLVKDPFAEARRRGWFEERDPRPLEQLLTFCQSVPLIGFH